MSFDAAASNAIFAALASHAQKLGIFARVNLHEPENAPGNGLSCAIVLSAVAAEPAASGLGAVSGRVTFMVHVRSPMMARPLDGIDPAVVGAVGVLLNEYSGAFSLGAAGGTRNIDLMGLRAAAGYLLQEGKEFRTIQITVPVIVNDMWSEVA
jgi:hypothetical protein